MEKSSPASRLVRLYDGQPGYVSFYVRARSRLLRLSHYSDVLPSRGLVIDVGCGYGVLANYLSLSAPERQVLGIDRDEKRIDAARKTIGGRDNISFCAEDVAQWAWPGCTGIAMTDFLHHLPPPEQETVLKEASGALQKDGVLLISEVDPDAKPAYKYWASYLSDRILYPLSRSYFRKPSAWKALLSSLGFEVRIIELRNPVFAGVLLVCRKSTTGASNESRVLQT